jgi:hypothetical protein
VKEEMMMSRFGWFWGGILTLASTLSYGQPSAGDAEDLVRRSAEAWNRQHRGAYSIRWTEDADVAAVLAQLERVLPETSEGELQARVTAADAAGVEVSWSLTGAMREQGSLRVALDPSGAVRQAAK